MVSQQAPRSPAGISATQDGSAGSSAARLSAAWHRCHRWPSSCHESEPNLTGERSHIVRYGTRRRHGNVESQIFRTRSTLPAVVPVAAGAPNQPGGQTHILHWHTHFHGGSACHQTFCPRSMAPAPAPVRPYSSDEGSARFAAKTRSAQGAQNRIACSCTHHQSDSAAIQVGHMKSMLDV